MRAGLLLAVVALASGTTVARALDFQLRTKQVQEDGFTRELTYFSGSETTRVLITLPRDWTPAATANSLTLAAPGTAGGTIRLEKSPLRPDVRFDEQGLTTYQRAMSTAVPAGAAQVRITGQQENPLPIMHWQSHEFTLSYDFFGQSFCRSVLFLNLDAKEQIICTISAPKAVFDAVHNTGFDLLRSWQIEPVK